MTFDECYAIISHHEGGYVNDPHDFGGETYRGIARNHESDWIGWPVLDKKKQAMGGQIKWNWKDAELDELAKPLFKKKYWDTPEINRFPALLHLAVFDSYVNSGPNTWGIIRDAAGLKWSRSLNDDLYKISQTISLRDFTDARKSYFMWIARNRPGNEKFLDGWIMRAEDIFLKST